MLPKKNHQLRVSISTEKLLELIASGAVCVADLTPIDAVSHTLLRHIALEACCTKLKGYGNECQNCASKTLCQMQSEAVNQPGTITITNTSFNLH